MVTLKFANESVYTYKDLLDLNDPEKSYKSPLSVIAHIDINAFYAQCEQIRLGLTDKDPVVCLQWNTLVAVSYAARDYGVNRMDTLDQAKLKCPNLIAAHTAVFKKGQPVWKYTDYLPSPVDHKVSLDPYRRESRKIMNIFKSSCDMVEKASVDECFLDLGRSVFEKLIALFPNILAGMDTQNDKLQIPLYLPCNLNYEGFIIPKPHEYDNEKKFKRETEMNEPVNEDNLLVEDWDDIVMLIGSIVCFDLRKKIKDQLGYSTSGGVARVKTMAKLASDFKKPDQQTIIRNNAIPNFLYNFKITDFWSLGGKLGDYICEKFGNGDVISKIRNNYHSISDLSLDLEKNKDLAEKLFYIVRGNLQAPLQPRTEIKSMGSTKNFRGKTVSNTSDLISWFKVYVADLVLRLQELDEETEVRMRPKKLLLSVRSASQAHHSKQCSINKTVKNYEDIQEFYFAASRRLLSELEKSWNIESSSQKMYPVVSATLAISGFVQLNLINTLDDLIPNVRKKTETIEDISKGMEVESRKSTLDSLLKNVKRKREESIELIESIESNSIQTEIQAKSSSNFLCPECDEKIELKNLTTHQDFHIALKLHSKFNKNFEDSYGDRLLRNRSVKKGKRDLLLGGQSRLPFSNK